MAAKRDYYEVLGIQKSASEAEIKKAFRRLAREYHPDVSEHPNAAERFKEINEAYAVLSDQEKRAAYDRFGHQAFQGSGGVDPFAGMADLGDIFAEIFGGGFRQRGGGRQAPRRGQDLVYRLTIDFEEAIFGAQKDISYQQTIICPTCEGRRAASGTETITCTTCNGSGEERVVRNTFLGQMVNITTCSTCRGTGKLVPTPCPECNAKGQVRHTRELTVNIPAGVDTGTQIRISGEGEIGANNGQPGSLLIAVTVRDHEFFRRNQNDLLIKVQLNVAQAALGHRVDVPVLTEEGERTELLDIPSGTQTGEIFTIKGRGVPRLRRDGTHDGAGNLEVMIEVAVPYALTDEQRDLFERLGETLGEPIIPPANERGFFDKVIGWLGG